MASTNRPHSASTLRGILAGVMRSNKLLTAALVVVIAADILLTLLPPLVLEGIVNGLTAGQEISLAVALLYFGAVAGSSAMDALKSASVTVAGQKVTHGLRSAMARKLDRLPAGYFTRHTGGAVSSLFVNDVDTVRALFDEGIVSMAIDVCKVVGIIAVIFTRSIGLGVLLLVVTPFLFLLTRAFQRRMLAAQLANRQAVANMNALVPETVRVMRTVRNLGRERFMEERYDTCVRDCFASMERVNLYDSVYSPIVVTCGSLVIAGHLPGLLRVEGAVCGAVLHEPCVRRGERLAVFDPNDLVKLGEERQPMRDEHHDAVCRPFAQPRHNCPLGCLVHGGEGVVENVEGPLARERARKGKACLLAAGEADPACAHERVCALRHRRDLLVELYQAQCGPRV